MLNGSLEMLRFIGSNLIVKNLIYKNECAHIDFYSFRPCPHINLGNVC
jgi:hypothetical protein